MMLPAGRIRKRVEIQRDEGITQNDYGETERSWKTIASVWAAIEPLRGRELSDARQLKADVTHKILLRQPSAEALTSAGRIKLGTRIFHLIEPPRNVMERGEMIEVYATEAG